MRPPKWLRLRRGAAAPAGTAVKHGSDSGNSGGGGGIRGGGQDDQQTGAPHQVMPAQAASPFAQASGADTTPLQDSAQLGTAGNESTFPAAAASGLARSASAPHALLIPHAGRAAATLQEAAEAESAARRQAGLLRALQCCGCGAGQVDGSAVSRTVATSWRRASGAAAREQAAGGVSSATETSSSGSTGSSQHSTALQRTPAARSSGGGWFWCQRSK